PGRHGAADDPEYAIARNDLEEAGVTPAVVDQCTGACHDQGMAAIGDLPCVGAMDMAVKCEVHLAVAQEGQKIACPSDKIPLANLPTGDRKESVVRGKDAHGPRGHPAQLSPRALQGRPAHSRRRVHRHDSDARRKMDSLERTEALGESRRQLRAIVRRLLMLSLLRAPWSIVAVHLVEAEA